MYRFYTKYAPWLNFTLRSNTFLNLACCTIACAHLTLERARIVSPRLVHLIGKYISNVVLNSSANITSLGITSSRVSSCPVVYWSLIIQFELRALYLQTTTVPFGLRISSHTDYMSYVSGALTLTDPQRRCSPMSFNPTALRLWLSPM